MRHYGIVVGNENGTVSDRLLVKHLRWEEARDALVHIAEAFGELGQAARLLRDEEDTTPSIEVVGADKQDLFTVTFTLVETA